MTAQTTIITTVAVAGEVKVRDFFAHVSAECYWIVEQNYVTAIANSNAVLLLLSWEVKDLIGRL